MTVKIVQEITEWKVPYRQPNHVYLMSGDRVLAMSRWGEGKPEYFRNPTRMDKRGRKFIEVKKNRWGFDLKILAQEEDKPQGETWEVQGSKGDIYTVSLLNGRYSCTCQGYLFRSHCKHIEQLSK